jgi:quercetin dioxygenase-like cupin family protein
MELIRKVPTVKGPAETFTGDVWFDALYRGVEPARARLNAVHFTPTARTAWHTHGLGQTLYVTEGTAMVATRSGEVAVLRPGEMVWCPPGEEHWHGAGPHEFMTHLALMEGDDMVWGDHVSDAEYHAAASRLDR